MEEIQLHNRHRFPSSQTSTKQLNGTRWRTLDIELYELPLGHRPNALIDEFDSQSDVQSSGTPHSQLIFNPDY
ncbi:hypothetical protein JTE90_000884 [Oedothorax gibbosus]|uniref:Uncharacterized protein n=1 Tax=Oedothorax gibbosus TaxID=931172 RepID=A0AAV6VUM5_9ARAC|nr:hypothetical protein JTE90_000884 [Oedothorax gibbosus]